MKSAPTVRATYLLEICLEERIIATYFTLLRQPNYHFSFCGNLLASPTLCVYPVIPGVGAFSVIVKTDCETDGSSAALVKRLQLVPKHHPRLPVMTASMHPASTSC